jgi:hypothetical protein
MKKIFLPPLLLLAIFLTMAHAQRMPAEIMIGEKYIMYQHNITSLFKKDSRFGIVHIANLSIRYNNREEKNKRPNEIMNQAYIRMKLSNSFSVLAGGIYTRVTKYRGSFAIQFAKQYKNTLLVVSPRMDIRKEGAFELFSLLEYRSHVSDAVKLYSRLQAMTSHGPHTHNKSYQQLRLGLDIKNTQFGIGLNLDEYGSKPFVLANAGLFIRKELF